MMRFAAADLAVSLADKPGGKPGQFDKPQFDKPGMPPMKPEKGQPGATSGSESATCEGAVCYCGDTCTNVTSATQKPGKTKDKASMADLSTLLVQLREVTAG